MGGICLQAYAAAVEGGGYRSPEPFKYPSAKMLPQMVAMELESSQLCPESYIPIQQSHRQLNLLLSKPQCQAPPLNHIIVAQPGVVTVIDTMLHQIEHDDSV